MRITPFPVSRFLFAFAVALSLGGLVSAAESKRMNVLFIASDDLRTELGVYGGLAQTPNLNRLAAKGVRFERAYCQYPLCNPSRSSMLTGRHPTTTKVYGNRDWFGGDHPEWLSLPKYFKEQGYVTVRSGKMFHGGIDDFTAWTRGGEPHNYGARPAPDRSAPASKEPISASAEKERVERQLTVDRGRAASSDLWQAVEGEAVAKQGDTLSADRAIAYLRERQQSGATEPFFLACGFSKPHSPLVAPKQFFDLYKTTDIPLPPDFAARPTVPEGFPAGSIRAINADLFIGRDASTAEAKDMIRAYLACTSYMDWNVGRVIDELNRLGLAENTLVVFWSDHGYQLGEKGKWSKAGSLWEQGARVPLIIYDPRAKGNGTASPRIVQLIDVYPTLVELAGLPPATGLDGLSLAPLLQNPAASWDHPAYTVWNERNRGITGAVVRTERWRYAEFFGRGAGSMLTDPIADPHELKNLAADPAHAAVVKELSALLAKYTAGQTEPTAAP